MWVTCQSFIGSGNIRAKGGNGNTYGGGGAGGRITVYYVTGGFHSDQTDASGGQAGSGSSVEPGGPGVVYLEGQSPVVKNLRIDNKGRKPLVSHCVFFFFTTSDLDFQTYCNKFTVLFQWLVLHKFGIHGLCCFSLRKHCSVY